MILDLLILELYYKIMYSFIYLYANGIKIKPPLAGDIEILPIRSHRRDIFLVLRTRKIFLRRCELIGKISISPASGGFIIVCTHAQVALLSKQ